MAHKLYLCCMKQFVKLLALLLVAGSARAQYNSLLWRISGNGLKDTSYLFGTMHVNDNRIVAIGDANMKYLDKTTAYAMELDPDKMFSLGIIGKLKMGGDYSLKQMMPEHEYHILDSVAQAQLGLPMKLFDNVAPVVVMGLFESAGLQGGDSSTGEVLDLHFHSYAKKHSKKVIGIETVDEQLTALNSLSYQEQADLLVDEIREFEKNKETGTDIVKFYVEQNLDSLGSYDNTASMPPKFYKALVTDRNKRMANRIPDFIKKQPTFIAIGALHLPGDEGVIALLRKKGFVVEPVK